MLVFNKKILLLYDQENLKLGSNESIIIKFNATKLSIIFNGK